MHRTPPSDPFLFVKRLTNGLHHFIRGETPSLSQWAAAAREQGNALNRFDLSGWSSRLPKMQAVDKLLAFLGKSSEDIEALEDGYFHDVPALLVAVFIMLFEQHPRFTDSFRLSFNWTNGEAQNSRHEFKKLSALLFADYLHRKGLEREILSPLYGAFLSDNTFGLLRDFPDHLQNCRQAGDLYRYLLPLIPPFVHQPKNPYVGWWGALHPELYHKSWGMGGIWEEYGDLLEETLLKRDIYALYLHHSDKTEKIHALLKIFGLYEYRLYTQSQDKLDRETLQHIVSLSKCPSNLLIGDDCHFWELQTRC